MTTIDKVAWVALHEGRVLCVRSHGKSFYYLPGGKREAGESDQDCVRREVGEELGVALQPESLQWLGVFESQADGKPEGHVVRMTCYRGRHVGELRAQAEIAELAWFGLAERGRLSRVGQLLFDWLHARGELR
jgi:8-oxo-dGTP diphosphatase